MSQQAYDIAEFITHNKAVLVRDLTPFVQYHLASLAELPTKEFEDQFIDLILCFLARKLSEETGLTIDQISAIVDLDFITSISGTYFFEPERFEYRNQN